MIFCASASGSAERAAAGASVAATAGVSGAGAGAGEEGAAACVRRREIGGRMSRFTVPSASVRFGFGFFSSIRETVSTERAVGAGFGDSAGFDGASTRGLTGASACVLGAGRAVSLGLGGASAGSAFETFAGAGVFALFGSFRFGSAAAELRDGAAALTDLRAVAVLRAAVVLVVVLVAIKKFWKFGHGRFAAQASATVPQMSPGEPRRGCPSPSLRPPHE